MVLKFDFLYLVKLGVEEFTPMTLKLLTHTLCYKVMKKKQIKNFISYMKKIIKIGIKKIELTK